MNGPIDFAEINRAALAAFPAVLARILPGGQAHRRGDCRAQSTSRRSPARIVQGQSLQRALGRLCDRRQGRRSDFACRLSRRRFAGRGGAACSPECWESNPAGRTMADGLDFSPLSDDEREVAAQEPTRDGEPDADKPTLPPADAEAPEDAAARLFGPSAR